MTKRPSEPPLDSLQSQFGANLRAARERLGMSQDQLSEASGHTRAHIYRIESGRANITFDTAQSLATVVGATVIELLQPPGTQQQNHEPLQTTGVLPIRSGTLALELPAGKAFEVAVVAAGQIGRAVHLIDPSTREIKAVVPKP